MQLLKKAQGAEGVKKVLVAIGVRYDLAYDEKSGDAYIRQLVMNHVGGHLNIGRSPSPRTSCS